MYMCVYGFVCPYNEIRLKCKYKNVQLLINLLDK